MLLEYSMMVMLNVTLINYLYFVENIYSTLKIILKRIIKNK